MADVTGLLRRSGIRLTPQRIAVAEQVLSARAHPTADQVWARVRRRCPTVSRATVYNTLHLLVEKRLIRTQVLREGTTVFDPIVEAHHHFIDVDTGRIYDIPWDSIRVSGQGALRGFDVRDYQVILRGRRRPRGRAGSPRAGRKRRRLGT
jgi:Fe2+ or Zn2+ uptake regulation protein